MRSRRQFYPVSVLKHGILHKDGHMVYTDTRGNWLYVAEDGQTVVMYSNVSDLIREWYKRDDSDDYVITGWDFEPYKFADAFEDAYRYYNARFED